MPPNWDLAIKHGVGFLINFVNFIKLISVQDKQQENWKMMKLHRSYQLMRYVHAVDLK